LQLQTPIKTAPSPSTTEELTPTKNNNQEVRDPSEPEDKPVATIAEEISTVTKYMNMVPKELLIVAEEVEVVITVRQLQVRQKKIPNTKYRPVTTFTKTVPDITIEKAATLLIVDVVAREDTVAEVVAAVVATKIGKKRDL